MFTNKKHSVTLVQGVFQEDFYDVLKSHHIKEVFVLEGRPSLDAARKTTKAFLDRKVKVTLIADNMAGFCFFKDLVKDVYVAHQTVDKHGALCSIGGLILGVLAKKHAVRLSTFPAARKLAFTGQEKDIFSFGGERVAPKGIQGYVPLVEWVPKKYIYKNYE